MNIKLYKTFFIGFSILLLCGCPVDHGSAGRSWHEPVLLETLDTGDACEPKIGFDGRGNAVAVWKQFDGSLFNIRASRFDRAAGNWSPSVLLDSQDLGNAEKAEVALTPAGRALVVWRQSNGAFYHIWSNQYDPVTGWKTAELLETNDTAHASGPRIAVDASGNAFAVFGIQGSASWEIYAARFDSASATWLAAEKITTVDPVSADNPVVAFDAGGNAFAVWEQFDATTFGIWARRYDAVTGWGAAGYIDSHVGEDSMDPRVVFDGQGNAFVVWTRTEPAGVSVWAGRYNSGTGSWDGPAVLESGSTWSNFAPRIAADGAGRALVVWIADLGTQAVLAGRYDPVSGWTQGGDYIQNNILQDAYGPTVCFDNSDGFIAVWGQSDGLRENIWARVFAPGTGWADWLPVENNNLGHARMPETAADAEGNVIAVWHQFDGTRYSIWANRYAK